MGLENYLKFLKEWNVVFIEENKKELFYKRYFINNAISYNKNMHNIKACN